MDKTLTHYATFKPKKTAPDHLKDIIAIPVNGNASKEDHTKKFHNIFGKSIAKHYDLHSIEEKPMEEAYTPSAASLARAAAAREKMSAGMKKRLAARKGTSSVTTSAAKAKADIKPKTPKEHESHPEFKKPEAHKNSAAVSSAASVRALNQARQNAYLAAGKGHSGMPVGLGGRHSVTGHDLSSAGGMVKAIKSGERVKTDVHEELQQVQENERSEYSAFQQMSSTAPKKKSGHYLVRSGRTLSGPHKSPKSAMTAYKEMKDNTNVKIVRVKEDFDFVSEEEKPTHAVTFKHNKYWHLRTIRVNAKDDDEAEKKALAGLKTREPTEHGKFSVTKIEDLNESVINEENEMSHAARELVLHADNDEHLYRSSHLPIISNLQKKVKKGIYNHDKAKKLWQYHADRAAHSYAKIHGDQGTPWHKMFSVADRKAAASHFADNAKEHLGLNENLKHVNEVSLKTMIGAYKERDLMNRYPGATWDDDEDADKKFAHSTTQQNKTADIIKKRYGDKGVAAAVAAANSKKKYSAHTNDPTETSAKWSMKTMKAGPRKGKLDKSYIKGLKSLHKSKLDNIQHSKAPNLPEEIQKVEEGSVIGGVVGAAATKSVKESVGTNRSAALTKKYDVVVHSDKNDPVKVHKNVSGVNANHAIRKHAYLYPANYKLDARQVSEELKVGDKEGDDVEFKKVRGGKKMYEAAIKRKYLGKMKGRTATGKPAHPINMEPEIGKKKNERN